jgi:hypothetical protein
MDSKELRSFLEAYQTVYTPQELVGNSIEEVEELNESHLSVYNGEQLNEKDSALDARIRSDAEASVKLADIEKRGGWEGQLKRNFGRFLNQRESGRTKEARDAAVKFDTDDAAAKARAKDAGDEAVYRARGGDAQFTPKKPAMSNIPPPEGPQNNPDFGKNPVTPPAKSPAKPPAKGPVLSKLNGVEGTGVGKDFKPRAFTAAEKSRYASVAAQNAAKSSASSGTPKPSPTTPAASAPKPAVGKLGNTSFERRTPTSAELKAAQAAKAGGASPEKALQAAQKTNLPTQGNPSAKIDTKSVEAAKAAFKPTPTPKPVATPTPTPTPKPVATPTPKPVATPTPKPVATPVVKRDPNLGLNPRERMRLQSFDLFDVVKGHLLDEGYAESEDAAMVIMVNMSEEWRQSILESYGVELVMELTGGKGHPGYKAGSRDLGPMQSGHPADSRKRQVDGGTMSQRHGYHLGDIDDDDDDEDEDEYESIVKQQSRDKREILRKPLRKKVKSARKAMTKEEMELDESQYARENPEKYERDERKSQSNRERRMNDPKTGINSPAFQAFMAQQMGGKKKKKD